MNQYHGYFTAEIKDTKVIEPVVMTTPIGSHPVNSRYYRFSGLWGLPTPGTEILIKKAGNSKYWYFDSVVAVTTKVNPAPANSQVIFDKPYINGSIVDLGSSFGDMYLQPFSQMMGMMSPEGNYLALDDSSNEFYRNVGVRLVSKIKQRLTMNSDTGIVSLKNEDGDGITISSPDTTSQYGGNRITTRAKRSIETITDNGSLVFRVNGGGRTIDVENTAEPGFNTAGTPTDIDTGSVNISSQHNDITVKVYRVDEGRIFIDASEADGLVSIKAGKAGVEVYTSGDMHFLSEGAMNFRAGKDITIKSNSNIYLNPDNEVDKSSLSDFTLDNSQLEEGAVG